MEKLCCFSATPEGPSLEVELKCVTTCCVQNARSIEVDFVDGDEDKETEVNNVEKDYKEEEGGDQVTSCCCFKRTCKPIINRKVKNE